MAYAQQYFQKLNGAPNNWDHYNEINQQPDSSYLAFGFSKDFFAETDSAYFNRLYIDKLDTKGNQLYRNYYPYANYRLSFFSILHLNNSLAVLHQQSNINDTTDTKIYLSYVNANGDTTLTRRINAMPLGGDGIRNYIINNKHQFIFQVDFGKYVGDSIYLCATDTLGNVLWVKEHKTIHKGARGMVQTDDGGYLLSGYLPEYIFFEWIGGTLKYVGYPSRAWLAKFDNVGNEVWQKALSGLYYEPRDSQYDNIGPRTIGAGLGGIIALSNGTYLAYGQVNIFPYLVNINQDGTILWEHKYDSAQMMQDFAVSAHKGDFFRQVIEKNGYLYGLGQKHEGNNNFFWKLTLTGKRIWSREFFYQKEAYNELGRVEPLDDGFLLLGTARDTANWEAQQDAWIIKIDTNGCLQAGCHLNDTVAATPFVQKSNKTELTIYPNPNSTGIFTISGTHTQPYTVKVTDATGKQILYTTIYNGTIDVSVNPNGMYYVRVEDKDGNVLIKQAVVIVGGR
jgi:hypothetical protein